MKPPIAKLWILVALRHEEQRLGVGHRARVAAGDVAVARSLAVDGLVELGRAPPPTLGTTVTLTPDGRDRVDAIARTLLAGASC